MSEKSDKEINTNFGPKHTFIKMVGTSEPVSVVFPSSIQYNKAVKIITEDFDDWDVEIRLQSYRVDINPTSVDWLTHDPKYLELRKSSKIFIGMQLIFECGKTVNIPICGEHRMRIAYKALESLIGKAPDKDLNSDRFNTFIKINQEENKSAYIRYTSALAFIKTRVIEDPTKEWWNEAGI